MEVMSASSLILSASRLKAQVFRPSNPQRIKGPRTSLAWFSESNTTISIHKTQDATYPWLIALDYSTVAQVVRWQMMTVTTNEASERREEKFPYAGLLTYNHAFLAVSQRGIFLSKSTNSTDGFRVAYGWGLIQACGIRKYQVLSCYPLF